MKTVSIYSPLAIIISFVKWKTKEDDNRRNILKCEIPVKVSVTFQSPVLHIRTLTHMFMFW